MRFIEALVLVLVMTIGGCYFAEIFVLPQTRPNFGEMGAALARPGFREDGMIVVAIGIIGATVMPHNLYLHSAVVQSRRLSGDEPAVRRAIRFNTLDTVAALGVAFFVNAAILVLAAMTFHGHAGTTLSDGTVVAFGEDTDWIREAYHTLSPLMGAAAASTLFGIALLASGQSSTITGTLAGQVVMEGFLNWRVRPWVRRIITRLVAIIPAILVIGVRGEGSVTDLLVLSQVVLAMQLPLAMFPLLHFTSSRKVMGKFRNGWFLLVVGWASCLVITALDVYGLPGTLREAWDVIAGK
jgi:manganese transport protein